jgi:hypothetical protein
MAVCSAMSGPLPASRESVAFKSWRGDRQRRIGRWWIFWGSAQRGAATSLLFGRIAPAMCASVDAVGARVPVAVRAQPSCATRPGTAPTDTDASSVAKLNAETGVDCGRDGAGGVIDLDGPRRKFHVLYLLRPTVAEVF